MYDSPDYFDAREEMAKIERIKQSYAKSIVPNLLQRELHGKNLSRSNPFGEFRPERLRYSIENIIPRWAMMAGNIFMGFTECGRYLLSYTVRSTESDFGRFLWSDREDWTFEYQLHFWLFKPNAHVRKVCSVLLFDNYGICHDSLLIEISQWKGDQNRLLITGRSDNPALPHNSQQFVTITTIPDVINCTDCHYGPPDEFNDDGDFGERGLIRSTCVRHGLTVHLAYEVVAPFPRFNPDIALRFKDSVVFNTGNLFHTFTLKLLEPNQSSPFRTELLTAPQHAHALAHALGIGQAHAHAHAHSKKHQRLIPRHLRCDFWFKNCRAMPRGSETFRLLDSSELIFTESAENENVWKVHAQEKILALLPLPELWVGGLALGLLGRYPSPSRRRRNSQSSQDSELSSTSTATGTTEKSSRESPAPDPMRFMMKARMAAVAVMPPPDGVASRKFFKRLWKSPVAAAAAAAAAAGQGSTGGLSTYDISTSVEDTLTDRNFSSFRKRRLADKKYEFNDGDDLDLDLSENMVPLKLSRKVKGQSQNKQKQLSLTISPMPSPSPSPSSGEILKSINTNATANTPPMLSPSLSTTEPNSGLKRGQGSTCHKNARPNFTTNLNCIAKVLRCFADAEDDGSLSVKTDTDDEYRQTLPFPVALQLKVHGGGYRPMGVISNSRSRRCPTPVVEILQRTLDIEVLCNEVSGLMCLAAEKSYSSCFDYDVAIVDVCQERGSITAVAYVLLTATSLRWNSHQKFSSPNSRERNRDRDQSPVPGLGLGFDQKQNYEATFTFIWEPIEEECRILYMGNLKELHTVPKQWHPTKRLVPNLRSRLYDTPFASAASQTTKTLRNDLAVKDWQSLQELTDAQGIITLYREKHLKRAKMSTSTTSVSYPSPALSSGSSSSPSQSQSPSQAMALSEEEEDEETEGDNWLY